MVGDDVEGPSVEIVAERPHCPDYSKKLALPAGVSGFMLIEGPADSGNEGLGAILLTLAQDCTHAGCAPIGVEDESECWVRVAESSAWFAEG